MTWVITLAIHFAVIGVVMQHFHGRVFLTVRIRRLINYPSNSPYSIEESILRTGKGKSPVVAILIK